MLWPKGTVLTKRIDPLFPEQLRWQCLMTPQAAGKDRGATVVKTMRLARIRIRLTPLAADSNGPPSVRYRGRGALARRLRPMPSECQAVGQIAIWRFCHTKGTGHLSVSKRPNLLLQPHKFAPAAPREVSSEKRRCAGDGLAPSMRQRPRWPHEIICPRIGLHCPTQRARSRNERLRKYPVPFDHSEAPTRTPEDPTQRLLDESNPRTGVGIDVEGSKQ